MTDLWSYIDFGDTPSAAGLPDTKHSVCITGDDPPATCAELRKKDRRIVRKQSDTFACGGVPNPGCPIFAGCDKQLSIRTVINVIHLLFVPVQFKKRLRCSDIQYSRMPVHHGNPLAVRTELGGCNLRPVTERFTERGARTSGARFYYLTGDGALLQLAMLNLAIQQAVETGFTPMIPPVLVRSEAMEAL